MQELPLNDPKRPQQIFKPYGEKTWPFVMPDMRPDLVGLFDWQKTNAAWGMKLQFPAVFTGAKYSAEPLAMMFAEDFAIGLQLDQLTAELEGNEFWQGSSWPANLPGPFASSVPAADEAAETQRAVISDRINAAFQSAHTRNRWDLLDLWYPLVAARFASWERPYFQSYDSVTAPYILHEPKPGDFEFWPQIKAQRQQLEDAYSSGQASFWWTELATSRIGSGMPTPNWIGPFVPYTPYWWIKSLKAGSANQKPHIWTEANHSGKYGQWGLEPNKKVQLSWPLNDITATDVVVKIVGKAMQAAVGGAMLSAATAGIWASLGAPAAPTITNALAQGIQSELGGGDFLEGAVSGILAGAGDLVTDLGGSELLSSAADLAAGNLDTGEALSLLSDITDGLGWVDDSISSANDFMDALIGIGDSVSNFGNAFNPSGNPYGGSPPPIFNEGEAAGLGQPGFPTTNELDLADAIKPQTSSSTLAFAALGALILFAA